MTNPSYYEILQISSTATLKEIKTAFRRLARQYHPDLNPDNPNAAEKFKKVCQAYKVLGDPQQRHQYDQQLPSYSNQTSSVRFTDQDFYQQGLRKTKEKDYRGAIASYTQAIRLNSQFWQAYLNRCELYYQIVEDRAVLEDCQQILQLNSNCAQAYYYQGLARQRLGYTQSALTAYTEAIQLDPNYAQAFYQRGLTHEELKDYSKANQDLYKAAELFYKAGNFNRYHLIQEKRKKLFKNYSFTQTKKIFSSFQDLPAILINLFKSLWLLLSNPRDGMVSAFLQLEKGQAIIIGALSGIIAAGCLSLSWQNWAVNLSFYYLIFIGFLPFLSLALSSYLIRFSGHLYGYFAGDIFLAGLTILPLSLIVLGLSNLKGFSQDIIIVLKFIAIFYSGWILYNGYVQVSNFPAKIAIFMTSLMITLIILILCGVYYLRFV